MKKFGLALGGGGFKGLAHIGVLQILQDYGLKPAYISGSSAGSIVAALFACQINPYTMEKMVYEIKVRDYLDYDWVGLSKYLLRCFLPFVKSNGEGFLKGKRIENYLYKLTAGKTLKDISMPISIVACDINTGKKVIFTNQRFKSPDKNLIIIRQALLSKAVRASIAVPIVFIPEYYLGMKLLDGGLKDYVPSMVQNMMGAPYVLAVNLGQKTYQCPVKGILPIASRSLDILTFETSSLEDELFADRVIYPNVKNENWDNNEQARYIIQAGRYAMEQNIKKLLRDLTRPMGNRIAPSNIY